MLPDEKPYDPAWSPSPAGFAPATPVSNLADELLGWARLSLLEGPSRPPWTALSTDQGVEVRADREHGVSPLDPEGREMTIGAGAFLFNLRVGAAYFGIRCDVAYLPEAEDSDLLARVRLAPGGGHEPDLSGLFPSLARRPDGRRLEADPVSEDVLDSLAATARKGPARVRFVMDAAARAEIAALVAEGDRSLFADPGFRYELGARARPPAARGPAGRDGFLPVPDLFSSLSPWYLSSFDLGGLQAQRDFRVASEAPMLAVVHAEETPSAWLAAGEEVERVVLAAARLGVAVSFLNQPIEVRALRAALRTLLSLTDWPQLLLRLGMPRRARARS